MNVEPAYSIIEVLGGVRRVAEVTGRHYSRVYRWMYPDERGGTGGIIPAREQKKLLSFAQENNLDLIPSDFFDASRLVELRNREAAE